MREIVDDVGMREIERAGRGVVAVALLGHGQRDDVDARIGDAPHQRRRVGSGEERLAHRADHAQRDAILRARDHAVKPVLGRERRGGARRLHRNAEDAPARIGRQHAVGEHRLMRAVECAEAQVDDADADRTRIVGGALDVPGKSGQRREAK